MSEAIAPIKKSFASAEEAVFHKLGPHTIPIVERPQVPSIASAVYYYKIPQQAVGLARAGLQKHVMTESGPVSYTSISTKILHDAPPPIAVHMAGFLPGSELTYTYRTKAIAYLGEQREAAGRTTSIVVGMDTGQNGAYRGTNIRPRGPSNDLSL